MVQPRSRAHRVIALTRSLFIGLALILGLVWLIAPQRAADTQTGAVPSAVQPAAELAQDARTPAGAAAPLTEPENPVSPGAARSDVAFTAVSGTVVVPPAAREAMTALGLAPAGRSQVATQPQAAGSQESGVDPLAIARGSMSSAVAADPVARLAGPTGNAFSTLAAPPIPGDGNPVLSLGSERIWGVIDPGETVTVTVNGVQMGAARSDAVGFYWTALYNPEGRRPGLAAGDTVALYREGVLMNEITLRAVDAELDIAADSIAGTISGVSTPVELTLYVLDDTIPEPEMATYSTTVSTNAGGAFSADFTGDWPLVGWDHVVVTYVEDGVQVQQNAYAAKSLMVRPAPWSWVFGRVAPGEAITITVYESNGVTEKARVETAAGADGFYLHIFGVAIEEDNIVVLTRAGAGNLSRTIDPLTATVDAAADQVTGEAAPGAEVMARLEQNVTPDGNIIAHATAIADGVTGAYTLDFGGVADILPGTNIPVFVDDAEGDNINIRAVAPSVVVNQTWDEISGFAPAPPGPAAEGGVVDLTLHSAALGQTFTYTCEMKSSGEYSFDGPTHGLPDIAPGDTITVEAEGDPWQGVVHVRPMAATPDIAADRITGTITPPGNEVEVWGRQWSGWSAASLVRPVAELFRGALTTTGPFTVTPPGIDVRSLMGYEVRHRTADDYLEVIYGATDYVSIWPTYNVVAFGFAPPGTPYTLTLRDAGGNDKGQLTGTSGGPIGSGSRSFRDVDVQIVPGDLLQAQSAAGYDQTITVTPPYATLREGSDTIGGFGPPNAHVSLNVDDRYVGFVPTGPDGAFTVAIGQLQIANGDGILGWGQPVRLCTSTYEGNLNCAEIGWPRVTLRVFMDGANDVFGNFASTDHGTLITVTHPVSGVIATATTTAGTGWEGPQSYYTALDPGVLTPGVVVTADFGDAIVETVEMPSITGAADVATDRVTGEAPPNSVVTVVARDRRGAEISLNDIQVAGNGSYLADFGAVGWDILPGHEFSIYYPADRGHEIEYNFWLPAPDLSVSKWNPPGQARPGGVINYGVWYGNDGDEIATGVELVDVLPADTTYAGDNSGITPEIDATGVITWHLGDLQPGENYMFVLTLHVDGAVTSGSQLEENCATIGADFDRDPDNNGTCAGRVDVQEGEIEIGVDKWANPGDPTPGQEFVYDIRVCNNRGGTAGPVVLTDTLPANTSVVRWHHDNPWAVGWQEVPVPTGTFALRTPGFPGNSCDTIHLRLLLDAGAPLDRNLSNHVVVDVAGDVAPDNDEFTYTDAYTKPPRYDLSTNKWFNGGILVPGGWIGFGTDYWNGGNMLRHAGRLTDTLPAGTAYQPDSAYRHDGQALPPSAVTGEHVVWDIGDVAVADGFGYDFNVDIGDDVLPGTVLTNCVTIGAAEPEDEPNNTACATAQIFDRGPNLRVTEESWWNGIGELGYRLRFYNVGDETVEGIRITDTLPLYTHWNGGWNLSFDQSRLVTHSLTGDVLAWQFSELYPGDHGQIEFSASLEDVGPLRWFTNTVEIDPLDGDVYPDDNTYVDVAFSGGEIQWVDLDVYRTRIWACAPVVPITVTTKDVEWATNDNCFDRELGTGFLPGDTVTMTAGKGRQPVVIHIPDPFVAAASSITETVWGQVDHLDHEEIQIDLGGFPARYATTDNDGHFRTTFVDVPRAAQGDILYRTEIDYAKVAFHGRFQTPDLAITANYSHDWIEGTYESDHTVVLTVTDHLGEVEGIARGTTGPVTWWTGQTGFSTNDNVPWDDKQPDIVVGDWVYGAIDGIHTTAVQVGEITGVVDLPGDSVAGEVNAPWFTDPLDGQCWIDGVGNSTQDFTVDPDGGTYACDFAGVWDLTPDENVSVQYYEPDGDAVRAVFQAPAPHLRIEKWLDGGNPGEDGNVVFYVQYRNEGDTGAENVVITDTLQGMTYLADTSGFDHTGSGNQVVWDLGTVPPGNWVNFSVFARVDAPAGDRITNTVEIATSTPYDRGDPGEKRNEWSGDVQPNDTSITVGKDAWTGDPAAGYDVVFNVSACNKGGTGSTQVTITDTLHPSMTLQSWWADSSAWTEVIGDPQQLVVTRPALAGWRCDNVYVRATVAANAWAGMELWNRATIYAANDQSVDDDETWWHGNVADPHINLLVEKWWNSGQLVPGGELRYQIQYRNTGNIPVGAFQITDTLPVSTTFLGAWNNEQVPVIPSHTGDGFVVWDLPGLDNGYNGTFEVRLAVDPDAIPGTLLHNTVEVTELPGEDDYKDNTDTATEKLYSHGPNLRVYKESDWHGDRPGHARYWFRIENVGDVSVARAVVTDTLPTLMVLESGISIDWNRVISYEQGPGADWFALTLGDLGPGYRLDTNFDATMEEPVPSGLVLTNTVEVALPPEGDMNPGDNASEAVLRTGPDLWVKKDLISGDLLPGELITFSLAFGNDALGHTWWWQLQGHAVLTDTLPPGLEFVSARQRECGPNGMWCEHTPDEPVGGTLVWDLWPLGSGEQNEIVLTARIVDTVTGLDTFTNDAEIGSNEPISDAETDYDNNSNSVTFDIALPYFDVSKDYQSSRVAGTPVTYTLTVTNTGNSAGSAVVLGDKFPAGFTYATSDGARVNNSVQWTFATLAAEGGTGTGWFSGLLPCTTGTITNDDYAVIGSAEGVTGSVGAPVSFAVQAPTLVADFDSGATSVVVGTTVAFTDTTTTDGPAITDWDWDFGDGETSDQRNPGHTFDTEGVFPVRLTVTDGCIYTDTVTATITVAVDEYWVFLPLVVRH